MHYATQPINLTEQTSVGRFLKVLDREELSPGLIIFDTLARCAPGFDENAYSGMSLVVQSVDKIREETGATVMLVHHSTKPEPDSGKRHLRGHSALESAIDTLIHLDGEKDKPIRTLRCEKQKEAKEFPPIEIELQSVRVGSGDESAVPVRTG